MTEVSVPATRLSTAVSNARTLAAHGDLRGARATLQEVVESASRTLGADDPGVLDAARTLAGLHRDLGELSDARRVLEDALAAAELSLGDADPHLLAMSYDLARLADELGNLHEARRSFGRIVRHGPTVLGPDHEYVRSARRYLREPEPGRHLAPPPGASPWSAPPATARPAAPVTTTPPMSRPPAPVSRPAADGRATQPPPIPSPRTAPYLPTPVFPPDDLAGPAQPGADRSAAEPRSAGAGAWQPTERQPGVYRPDPVPAPRSERGRDQRPVADTPRRPTASGPTRRPAADPEAAYPSDPPATPDDRPRSRDALLPVHVPSPYRAGRARRRTVRLLGLVTAVALVAAASAALVVFVLLPKAPAGAPQAGSEEPVTIPSAALLLRLRDDGGSLTLDWTDPSGGGAPFVITGNRAGQAQSTLHTVPSGTTTYTLNGLDTRIDWCFAVAAVYSAQRTVLSNLACTHRQDASSAPAPTSSR
jgi:hypothetical protein